jgi:ribonuclease R
MLSVLRHYDLPLHFPKAALQEARAFGDRVAPEEIQGRTDCRSQQVITIDPDDAKDFDDAIFLERADSDQWRLWVHIADVSHYVKPGTALDKEAQRRGNSTYLVDRVIPMLPEALSNELCSLKPEVDRLTKSVEFLISSDGAVLRTRFHSSVIHSQRRFTYGEAFRHPPTPPPAPIERMLHDAHQLAQKIRRHRFKQGALALDFPERKIRLDEQGRVARIEKIENDVSHQLIEEFMLLANEAVAVHSSSAGAGDSPRSRGTRCPAPAGVPRGSPEPQRALRRSPATGRSPETAGAARPTAHRSRVEDRFSQVPDARPIRHRTDRPLRPRQSPLYALHLAHPAVCRSGGSPLLFRSQAGSPKALSETASHLSITERNSADAERDSKDVKLFAFSARSWTPAGPRRMPPW